MSSTAATPFTGLGSRAPAQPRSAIEPDAFDGERPVQRVVPASAAANAFEQYRQSAGSAGAAPAESQEAPQPEPESHFTEESSMARQKKGAHRRGRPTTLEGSPQQRICAALLAANTPLTGEQLYEQVGGDKTAFHSGTYLAKQAGRIEKHDDGTFTLTKAGREWVGGADSTARAQGARTRKAHSRGTRKASAKKSTRRAARSAEQSGDPAQGEAQAEEHTFRCAILSDGSFFLAKDKASIELDLAETQRMLRYLERMAELPAT